MNHAYLRERHNKKIKPIPVTELRKSYQNRSEDTSEQIFSAFLAWSIKHMDEVLERVEKRHRTLFEP